MVQGHMKMHLGNISLFLVAALLFTMVFGALGGTALAAEGTEVGEANVTKDGSQVQVDFRIDPDSSVQFDSTFAQIVFTIRQQGEPDTTQTSEIQAVDLVYDQVYSSVYNFALPAGADFGDATLPVYATAYEEGGTLLTVYLEVTVPPPDDDEDDDTGGGGGGGGPTPPPAEPPAILGSASQPIAVGEASTIELEGGPSLSVPAGAVATGGTVTLAAVQDDEAPAPGSSLFRVAGQAFEVTIADEEGSPVTSFAAPLELSFQVSAEQLPEGASASELHVFYYDTDLNTWLPVPTTVDVATGEVRASFTHLTTFAVLVNRQFTPMTDTIGHWAEQYVLRLVSLGIVNGVGANRFAPEAQVTRAEFAKMLVEAAGRQPALTAPGYTDVAEIPDWAVGYVQTANIFGWLKGDASGAFRPNDPITRQEIATVIARVTRGMPSGTLSYSDAAEVSDWAQDGVLVASQTDIITGYPDGSFRPKATATRAESSTMIWRLVKWLAQE